MFATPKATSKFADPRSAPELRRAARAAKPKPAQPPQPPPWEATWQAFSQAVEQRLAEGSQRTRDANLRHAEPLHLAGEIAEELLDVCAWSCLLWGRVMAIAEELHRRQSAQPPKR